MSIYELKIGEVYERTKDFLIFFDIKGSTYYFLLFNEKEGFCFSTNAMKVAMMIEDYCEQTFIPEHKKLGIKSLFESSNNKF